MENYQCLVIGISRYQFFKPLSYGEADAKAIEQFFREEAQMSEQQVLLCCDTSPQVKGLSTYPNQDNLLYWLKNAGISSTGVAPFWFFFNGYGLNYQGEDYLMPMDGNPEDIPNSGINVGVLLEILQQQTSRPILLILNLYSLDSTAKVGQQIITLTKEKGIALIFSLRSINTEIFDRHSLQSTFTTALLEAFRHYRRDITLAKLAQYLSYRLPELSFSSKSLVATPIVISPNLGFNSQFLLAFELDKTASEAQIFRKETIIPNLPELSAVAVANPVTKPQEETITPIAPNDTTNYSSVSHVSTSPSPSSKAIINAKKWYWLAGIGGLLCLIFLLFGVKWIGVRNEFRTGGPNKFPTSNQNNSTVDLKNQQKLLHQAMGYLKDNQASSFNRAINEVRKIPVSSPIYREAQEKIKHWSQVILEIAQGRAKKGDFQGAIAAAKLVPHDHKSVYSLAIEALKIWQVQAKQQEVNRVLLDGAKALIKPSEASSYNQGITILRQITDGELGYREAQLLINQWSQKIYLIANSRAAKGDYQQAIATAKLVPPDTSTYKIATQAIAKWKIKQN